MIIWPDANFAGLGTRNGRPTANPPKLRVHAAGREQAPNRQAGPAPSGFGSERLSRPRPAIQTRPGF